MAAQLGLDPQQEAAFERYVGDMRAHIQQMRREAGPSIGTAWAELAKPGADEAAVMQRFDDAAQKRRAFQQQLTSQTLAFLAILSPEQRTKFVELARRRPNPWSPRPEHEGGR
jgi:Spy/CpxP family protein refolding chaperone